ncbi:MULTISPECIES: DNA primase [Prochlorococcus]|uniref:DNA primase n=1 Tax=Prochlorococcus marinus (strain SARG / CCMP1375 / SS120) TaxID=167539 RepID=Q7VCI3_PROMA|nr:MULTISPECIES: DNA primase [Prochlorococcus]AAP99801.1 DNA primase [Prochlorococcus marinus subsp. marinus str. CCMP1375]KGG21840.1 DNA primase [Prochlorococcus marinus str. SS2]KGG23729.1 DNA primase [Prochlorococcus marinus str. SS35]KGG32035.1 DNA primase [Prochlorococcus marinus str. SS51]KGG35274.1 DNA primase [Prochlorococcus sp. SS52]
MVNPRLHPRTLDAVKEKADIVDVVGEHVVLKKKGKEFVGICPFHDDNRPSMTVSPAKQFYFCFSCGAGGNSIKFLMELQRQSFGEVVLELARKYQLPVETLDGPQQERFRQELSRKDRLLRVLSLAKSWFQDQLRSSVGVEALNYLMKTRQLNKGTIDSFELGYAPQSWDGLITYMNHVESISSELLVEAGLVVPRKSENGFYDRFRNRLIVPINDRQGRVIGFGGRSLDGSDPKYLNSPETELFEKGKHLFGLDKAANAIRKADKAIVVEGYFDVIALHSAGINNSVAALGTALSSQQIKQLCRCSDSKRIILNFDTDSAGIRAANRAIGEVEHLAMQGQLELRILQLPSSKDPDEYLQDHSDLDYKVLADNSPLWLDWQIDQILKDSDLSKADHFQRAVSGLVQLLGKLPQSALRSHYLQKVAELLSGGQARLALQLEEDLRNQIKGQRWHGRSSRFALPSETSLRERLEAQILRLYLHFPNHRACIRNELRQRELEDFALHHHRLLWIAISELEEKHIGATLLESISRGESNSQQLSEIELSKILLDKLVADNDDSLSSTLTRLLEPDEFQLALIKEPLLELRGTLAVLERQKALKRCRHLIEAWSGQRLETLETCISALIEQEQKHPNEKYDMELRIDKMFEQLNIEALNFQELYYAERKHILYLDQQRCALSNAGNETLTA